MRRDDSVRGSQKELILKKLFDTGEDDHGQQDFYVPGMREGLSGSIPDYRFFW